LCRYTGVFRIIPRPTCRLLTPCDSWAPSKRLAV
jgi:hypothetical protein